MVDRSETLTLSVPAAGKLLRLGRSAAYAAAASGELPTLKIGERLLVPKLAIARMLEAASAPRPQEKSAA